MTQGTKYRGEGRVDKQNGGKGHKAYCVIEMEALEPNTGFEFVNRLVGGTIPRAFLPSIEKGVKSAMAAGVLAGYPVVDVRVSVVDGSSHEVDSTDYAFAEAGRLAFLDACRQAPMILIEPVGLVEVLTPDNFVGPVLGDIARRRGRLLGQSALDDGTAVVRARVPVAETFGYTTDLRSLTQGRASFSMSVAGYAEVPLGISQALIARAAV